MIQRSIFTLTRACLLALLCAASAGASLAQETPPSPEPAPQSGGSPLPQGGPAPSAGEVPGATVPPAAQQPASQDPAGQEPQPPTPAPPEPVVQPPVQPPAEPTPPVQDPPAQPAPVPQPAPETAGTTTPAAGVEPVPAAVAPTNAAPPPAAAPAAAAPTPSLPDSPRDFATLAAALAKIAAEQPSVARSLDLGSLTDGRRLPALIFGAEGPLALDARPCILLLGALDGESATGGAAVLQISAELLREPATLPAGVAFVAVPWASPEALELSLQGRSADGRNTRPLDEDRDGRVDEDGADDLDGDGALLQMLIEDPEGPWVRSSNQRLLARARAGDAPRYSLSLEGKDDDGDGLFNEDGPGGVVLDLNFPVGRTGPWLDDLGGALPLSEALARNFADFALVRRAAIVILFQGNHGRLALPGGSKATAAAGWMPDADRVVYERVHASFLNATARRNFAAATLLECRGRERRGAAIDWFYSVSGSLTLELAPWGPTLDGEAESGAENARFDAPRNDPGKKPLEGVSAEDLAWARWLDDTRGGLGFVDWHPVDVGQGRQALVGGWEPGTRSSPPPENLARALQGLAEFTRRLSASLPRLELRVSEASRDGDVCRIRARVANGGALPTGLAISDRRVGSVGAWLQLELPAGARLITGEERCTLARLAGGGISRECEWSVVAPAGSTFSLRAGGDWTLPVSKELKP